MSAESTSTIDVRDPPEQRANLAGLRQQIEANLEVLTLAGPCKKHIKIIPHHRQGTCFYACVFIENDDAVVEPGLSLFEPNIKSDGCPSAHETLKSLLWATGRMLGKKLSKELGRFEKADLMSIGDRAWVARKVVDWKE